MTRDTATLMVGQYFKRRRQLVEIFLVSGSGLGISVMSSILRWLVRDIGWRLGIQVGLQSCSREGRRMKCPNAHCRIIFFIYVF